MGRLLLDSYPVVILPELACAVGLNEAIVLQQVHYWADHNRKSGKNFRDGRYWVYNSYSGWKEQFPWWSERTIQRTFSKLEERGLIESRNYNKLKMDRTKWYCINYDKLKEIAPLSQIDVIDYANLERAIPETKTEIRNEEVKRGQSSGLTSPRFPRKEFLEKSGNIFRTTTEEYGHERTAYMLSVVDWYIDDAYPIYTHNVHPVESKAKRMVFADKLLKCSDETVCDDQIIANTLHRALQEYTDCDPTIYYITNPKVLGYWIIKDEEIGYESVNGTEYAPVDNFY